jgi:dihydroorotate dehydrogenase electron transfer subunit
MPEPTAKWMEVFSLGEIRAGVLDLPRKAWPKPGQYLPAQSLTSSAGILPTHLFNVSMDSARLALAPLPADWQPGDRVSYLSPQGHGFKLPPSARRVALCALNLAPLRLLPLMAQALAQDATVSLFCDPQPSPDILQRIPSVVEVAPLGSLADNLSWPDYLAVDLKRDALPQLDDLLPEGPLPFEAQALVRTAMPCHGVGECGVCAVTTHHGLKLACADGPVFVLEEVLHVAR